MFFNSKFHYNILYVMLCVTIVEVYNSKYLFAHHNNYITYIKYSLIIIFTHKFKFIYLFMHTYLYRYTYVQNNIQNIPK